VPCPRATAAAAAAAMATQAFTWMPVKGTLAVLGVAGRVVVLVNLRIRTAAWERWVGGRGGFRVGTRGVVVGGR